MARSACSPPLQSMNCQHDSCQALPEGLRAFVVISMTSALAALTVRFSHRVSVAVAAACLGAAEAAFANIYWDVASDYYTHTVAGLLLCAAGNEMLNDGSPLQIKWWKGCIGSGTFTILFFALVFGFARRSGSTFNIGHRLVYFGLGVLLGAFGHVDCLRKIRQLRSRATAHSDENEKDAAGKVIAATARSLTPAATCSLDWFSSVTSTISAPSRSSCTRHSASHLSSSASQSAQPTASSPMLVTTRHAPRVCAPFCALAISFLPSSSCSSDRA